MIDITSISAVVAATGVIVGVVFAVLELRNATKQRRTELLMLFQKLFAILISC